jgi:type II secretory pathway predicted ATPase ExeA
VAREQLNSRPNPQALGVPPRSTSFIQTAMQRRALAAIGYGLAQGGGIVVIFGEAGCGKTALASHLATAVDPARVTVSASAGSAPRAKLERLLDAAASTGPGSMLVIDEAEALPLAILERLGATADWQPSSLIILLGRPELAFALQAPALAQLRRLIVVTHRLESGEPDTLGVGLNAPTNPARSTGPTHGLPAHPLMLRAIEQAVRGWPTAPPAAQTPQQGPERS